MDLMPVSYIPGDPMLIDNIVWELKSQGIFDTFRKECIADVDTKPAYQNLRQRVEGSVSSFLRKQTWSADLNKNQLREQLRKNIYESGYLETGVERIVDQVVNPKMNTVFLPKVTDVVYQYLGLEKPEVKLEKEKEDDLKIKSEDLLPKELEAISPESRQDDKNDDSNLSLESMKIDEDESPPFEPLEEDNSIDSHMSGISGLQSHDSNSSPKALQLDETQASKQSSDYSGGTAMEIDEPVNVESSEVTQDADSTLNKEHKSESIDDRDNDKEKDKHKHPESKSRSRSESKSDKNDKKHERSKDKYRDKSREKDKGRNEKDKRVEHRSSRHDRKKDDRRDKDKDKYSSSSSSRRDKEKEREKASKSRDDKSRSHRDSTRDRKSSSSRSDRDKDRDREKRDKEKDKKDRKDDHYSSKHKSERRSTDRDSNDGSGLKSSSSSYCESNSSSQHSHKESTNSNDSGQSGNSDKNDTKHKNKETTQKSHVKGATGASVSSCNVVLDSEVEHPAEIEIRPKTPPSMSVSAASWDALEAQLQSNVSYDTYYDSDHVEAAAVDEVKEPTQVGRTEVEHDSLKYFSKSSIDKDESNLAKATQCLAKLERQIEVAESELRNVVPKLSLKRRNERDATIESPMKKHRNTHTAGNNLPIINDGQNFHLPLSPAESDSDKSTDRRTDDVLPTQQPKRKANVHVTQRYSSDDLYKPRPVITRTTNRRRGILDNE